MQTRKTLSGFQNGFRRLDHQVSCDELELCGALPAWLLGRAMVLHHFPFGFHGSFFANIG
jgi:hypothetical protein